MRFRGTCYRPHDPRWAFRPLSGEGAALRGGRFNLKGQPALYLSLGVIGAVKEVSQGLARRIDPCVLCSYEVDCDDIVDLRTARDRKAHAVSLIDLRCPWFSCIADAIEPPSWGIVRRLLASGCRGILVPSFAPGATPDDHNLVLWQWSEARPCLVRVHDPSGRRFRNRLGP